MVPIQIGQPERRYKNGKAPTKRHHHKFNRKRKYEKRATKQNYIVPNNKPDNTFINKTRIWIQERVRHQYQRRYMPNRYVGIMARINEIENKRKKYDTKKQLPKIISRC
jgi:hypothetical protein